MEVALRKLFGLDSVSAVGFSGWKLYFRTVESPMRSSIVGWGKRKGELQVVIPVGYVVDR